MDIDWDIVTVGSQVLIGGNIQHTDVTAVLKNSMQDEMGTYIIMRDGCEFNYGRWLSWHCIDDNCKSTVKSEGELTENAHIVHFNSI